MAVLQGLHAQIHSVQFPHHLRTQNGVKILLKIHIVSSNIPERLWTKTEIFNSFFLRERDRERQKYYIAKFGKVQLGSPESIY